MKQVLYFLIGVLISGFLFLPLSNACDYDLSDFSWSGNQSGSEYMGTYGSQSAAISARTSHVSPGNLYLFNSSDSLGITNSGGSVVAVAVWGLIYDTSDGSYHNRLWVYSYVSGYDICDSSGDSDDDGLPDDCDVYPNDPSDYQVKLFSQQLDSGGNVVRECYITDRNDFACYGAAYSSSNQDFLPVGSPWQSPTVLCSYSDNYGPADPAEQELGDDGGGDDGGDDDDDDDDGGGDDVDLSGVESKLDNIKSGVDLANTKLSGIQSGVNSIDSKLTGIQTDVGDIKAGVDTANTKLTGIQTGVSEINTGIGTANTKLTDIVTGVGDVKTGIDTANTKLTGIGAGVGEVKTGIDTTNTKLTGIGAGVGEVKTGVDMIASNINSTNQNLGIIADSLGVSNTHLSSIDDKIDSLPTAGEIASSIGDNLIDSSQTIDTTVTDNISSLDKTETLDSINTKYSDRYDSFITTLKGSDLFSLPFGIFTGPSGSGSSIQTVNIGKWGSSTDQTATIDYSDYDNIWDILRTVLLLLTSFSCFKILVLKKG